MISIFNGRKRTLGGGHSQIFAQVGVDFRGYLHLFKGARLAVFLAIALHADENGWAFPSYRLLSRETGYNKDTIARALADLCSTVIEGERVLLRFQPVEEGGKFSSNRYLIFPSPDEIARFKVSDLPDTENPDTAKPDTEKPETENPDTKESHPKPEPTKAEPEKAEPAAAAGSLVFCSIHRVPMQARSRDGDTWYSHRLPGGSWCKGAPGDRRRADPHTDWRSYIGEKTATCPGCFLVGYADRLCSECGLCPDCCECETETEVKHGD